MEKSWLVAFILVTPKRYMWGWGDQGEDVAPLTSVIPRGLIYHFQVTFLWVSGGEFPPALEVLLCYHLRNFLLSKLYVFTYCIAGPQLDLICLFQSLKQDMHGCVLDYPHSHAHRTVNMFINISAESSYHYHNCQRHNPGLPSSWQGQNTRKLELVLALREAERQPLEETLLAWKP